MRLLFFSIKTGYALAVAVRETQLVVYFLEFISLPPLGIGGGTYAL
jgi:hypothetical protein